MICFNQRLGEGRKYVRQSVSPETQERLIRELMDEHSYPRSRVNRAIDANREIKSIFEESGNDLGLLV